MQFARWYNGICVRNQGNRIMSIHQSYLYIHCYELIAVPANATLTVSSPDTSLPVFRTHQPVQMSSLMSPQVSPPLH